MKARSFAVGKAIALGLLGALGFAAAGCPANLANPDEFPSTNLTIPIPDDGGVVTPPGCAIGDVFFRKCGGNTCHNTTGTAAGGLDLLSPNVGSRLINKPALHLGLMANAAALCPEGGLLIDTANPPESWLYKKVFDGLLPGVSIDGCGTQMPPIGNLKPADQNCIIAYIKAAAAATPTADGGPADAGAGD
jgi:hypothetical protein